MHKPFKLQQTDSATVYVLQTHRHLLPAYPDLDVHPNNDNDVALKSIKQVYHLPHQPYFMSQVHGANTIKLNTPPTKHFWQSADACYTFQQDIVCAVMTADCLPVLISDSQASFVAAVHCGWRSLYQGILTKTLAEVQSKNPLIVWFGPAICHAHYQVDKAFKDRYLQAHPTAKQAFTEVLNNHCYANLKTMALKQLHNYAIADIQDSQICTLEDEAYYSWRQNKTPARQASLIWLKQSH